MDEVPLHDWHAAAPALGLRSLAAVAMTVPALLAFGVYWLRHTPAGDGLGPVDNVMQVRLVASQTAETPHRDAVITGPKPSLTSVSRSDSAVSAAPIDVPSGNAPSSEPTSSHALAELPPAPAWDAPIPGSRLALALTTPDQKTMTFVRSVKSHIARFQYYPERAERERIQGTVGLVLTLQRNGTVTKVRIASSSGAALLDAAAVDMVKRAQPLPSIPVELPAQLNLDYTIAFDLPQ
ncbi:TonB family protein [Bradyrhizobium sp. 81013]|nr:energy transducer TonB [Bradyrhizobium aeschynomenes]NPV19265.1 TonB family protein [Bradyrhizobium aeschynomenes]